MSHFMDPGSALRKSAELVKVGQNEAALEVLTIIINSRRYRTVWQPTTHEKIMESYVNLAMSLRKSVREAFVKYRIICQDTRVASLEKIITKYRGMCEERAEKARLEAGEQEALDEDDFEDTPGALMLKAVSGEDTKDLKEKQIVVPWVKYLWEAYRNILEILRNNSKLQHVYQETARCAFKFCLKYKRSAEFRRLCDMLRKHLLTIQKYQHQTNSVDLSSPDTQKLYLETRFEQLEAASKLEMWQEAYRTIEDIHECMRKLKTPQTPTLMKTYYGQLSQIFWASENQLFHAYSLSQYFRLRCNEGIDGEDRTKLANSVLMATLAITPEIASTDVNMTDTESEENLRLASMLGFRKETPTRARLIKGLLDYGILNDITPAVRKIFELQETVFSPLSLTKRTKVMLDEIANDDELQKYIPHINKLTVMRIAQQIGNVYKCITIDRFKKLCPPMPYLKIERVLMLGVHRNQLDLCVDHQHRLIHFVKLRSCDEMGDQLSQLALACERISSKIQPENPSEKARERRHVFESVGQGIHDEHADVFKRKQEIEKRKQELEEKTKEKEKQVAEERVAQKIQRKEEEKKRLEVESKKRDEERVKKAEEEKSKKIKLDLAAQIETSLGEIKPKGKIGQEIKAILEAPEAANEEEMLKKKNEIVKKQKLEMERKTKEQIKASDYLVRALRIEETPLITKNQEDAKIKEKEAFAADFKKHLETSKSQHQRDLSEKKRLARALKFRDIFKAQVMAKRKEVYEDEVKKQQARLVKKKEERTRELARKAAEAEEERKNEEERRKKEEVKRAEEERKKREEEERLAEIKRKKEEEKQKKEEKEKERLDKLDAIAAKQREREAEIERREEEKKKQREEERMSSRNASREGADEGRWTRGGGRFNRGGDEPESRRQQRGGGGDERGGDSRSGGIFGGGGARDSGRDGARDSGRDGGRFGGGGGRFNRDGDRDGGRFGGRDGGGDRDRDGGRGGGGFGDRSRDGGGRFGGRDGGDRDGGRGFGGDRDGGSRFGGRDGGDRDRDGGGRFGGRDGGDRDRDGGGGFGDRSDRSRDGGGRFGARDGGDRDGGRDDRGGNRSRGGGDDDGGGMWKRGAKASAPAAREEKPESRPAPRAESRPAPRAEAPPAAEAPPQDDDGFTAVSTRKSKRQQARR